jgi:DNA topoisomerase-1
MAKNLVIVESPAKAKTIEKYLGKDFKVTSSMGHVRDLSKGDKAIDIENSFKPSYDVSPDKKELVKNLKKMVKGVDNVWLATDGDREGEAISWHLSEVLGLDAKTTKRIVFNEITEPAIKKAIGNPRVIDSYLVDAQQARRILDRIVGFELSPVLWKKVKSQLSAGRVQSVAVRLVVEREREINTFNSKSSYKVKAIFTHQGKNIEANCSKAFDSIDAAKLFLDSISGSNFSVKNIEVKPTFRNPTAPFTTSTLQQEASRKLGYSVSRTMQLAQRLYENGHITYMRTDSVNLSQTAIDGAKKAIVNSYGSEYSNPRKFNTKSESAQEAHEAIRPTYFDRTSAGDDNGQQRLYDLIWKRAISSQMSRAELEKTTLTINSSSSEIPFKAQGEVIKFDGFLKVYLEGKDDEEDDEQKGLLPPVSIGSELGYKEIIAQQKFSRPPARYTEASLVKKLEELGIGRPSTYAPTISTVQKRGYVLNESRDGKQRDIHNLLLKNDSIEDIKEKENFGFEKQKLFPTDIGMIVTDFLIKNFNPIMDYGFTASVEKEFDEIADGLKSWTNMLEGFYGSFHKMVETTTETADRATGERILGKDPKTGKVVLVRIGRYGPLVQIGQKEEGEKEEEESEIKFASLQPTQSIETIDLKEALKLFSLPRTVGEYEGHEVIVNAGRYGPYIRYNSKFHSLPRGTDLLEIPESEVMELLKVALAAPQYPLEIGEYNGFEVTANKGRFGPYLKYDDLFVSIPKDEAPEDIILSRAKELIDVKIEQEKAKLLKTFTEDPSIKIVKARWSPVISANGVKYKLAKDADIEKMTFADVQKIIEAQEASGAVKSKKKAPVKKTKSKAKPKAKAKVKKKVAAKKK